MVSGQIYILCLIFFGSTIYLVQHQTAGRTIFSFQEGLFKRMRLIAEQTLLSETTDRCPLSSIGSDVAACHLSHLNGPRGDPSVASELYTLLALTQSNARSALGGGRAGGSH